MLLSEIHLDGDIQAREALNPYTIEEYAEAMKAGAHFPPVVLFQEEDTYWIGDGNHRVRAALLTPGKLDIEAQIQSGTRRDALLYAVGANATHGQHRTREDKRRSVRMLLEDSEWCKWSNGEIARRCNVSDNFVGQLRKELTPNVRSEEVTCTTKHGTTTTEMPEYRR